MSTAIGRWRALAEALYLQSKDQRLKWTISDEKSVSVDFSDKKITIREQSSGNFETDIAIEISRDGWIIDSFDDTELKSYKPKQVKIRSYYTLMNDTFLMAKRQANGADQVLDSILSQLGAVEIEEESPHWDDDDVPF